MKNKNVYMILAALAIVSCTKNNPSEDTFDQNSSINVQQELQEGFYRGQKISYLTTDKHNIFEGDIIIPNDQISSVRSKSVAYNSQDFLWPNATVYYQITDENAAIEASIRQAIDNIDSNTELTFIEKTDGDNVIDFVGFEIGNANSAPIGYFAGDGNHTITLTATASVGDITHELGHVIGLEHEVFREDRDEFINIDWQNIDRRLRFNFNTRNAFGDNGTVLIGDFDANSIMMYRANDFALDPSRPVITLSDGSEFVRAEELSEQDITTINTIY